MMGLSPDLGKFATIGGQFVDCWRETNKQARIRNRIDMLRALKDVASKDDREAFAAKLMRDL